jgi:hypothetical protein
MRAFKLLCAELDENAYKFVGLLMDAIIEECGVTDRFMRKVVELAYEAQHSHSAKRQRSALNGGG